MARLTKQERQVQRALNKAESLKEYYERLQKMQNDADRHYNEELDRIRLD